MAPADHERISNVRLLTVVGHARQWLLSGIRPT